LSLELQDDLLNSGGHGIVRRSGELLPDRFVLDYSKDECLAGTFSMTSVEATLDSQACISDRPTDFEVSEVPRIVKRTVDAHNPSPSETIEPFEEIVLLTTSTVPSEKERTPDATTLLVSARPKRTTCRIRYFSDHESSIQVPGDVPPAAHSLEGAIDPMISSMTPEGGDSLRKEEAATLAKLARLTIGDS